MLDGWWEGASRRQRARLGPLFGLLIAHEGWWMSMRRCLDVGYAAMFAGRRPMSRSPPNSERFMQARTHKAMAFCT